MDLFSPITLNEAKANRRGRNLKENEISIMLTANKKTMTINIAVSEEAEKTNRRFFNVIVNPITGEVYFYFDLKGFELTKSGTNRTSFGIYNNRGAVEQIAKALHIENAKPGRYIVSIKKIEDSPDKTKTSFWVNTVKLDEDYNWTKTK